MRESDYEGEQTHYDERMHACVHNSSKIDLVLKFYLHYRGAIAKLKHRTSRTTIHPTAVWFTFTISTGHYSPCR